MTSMLGAASRTRVPAMGASNSNRVRASNVVAGGASTSGGTTAIVDIGVCAPIIRAYALIVKDCAGGHPGLQLPGAAPGGALRDPALRPVPGADGSALDP